MTRRMQMVLCLVVLAACVVALLAVDRPRDGLEPEVRALPRESSGARSASSVAAVERERTLPKEVPLTDFSRNRPTLEAMARSGNADAAFRLGEVLRACVPDADGPLAVTMHRQLSERATGQRREYTPGVVALDSNFRLDLGGLGVLPPNTYLLPAEVERVALCDGARDSTSADRAAAYEWLVLAADLGAPRAMAMRYDIELEHIGADTAARIDQAGRLIALRPRASAMLQRAADTGEPHALARMAQAHASGDLAERDALLADAYEIAADTMFERVGAPSMQAIQRLRASGDTARLAQVEDAVDTILARCCAPESP